MTRFLREGYEKRSVQRTRARAFISGQGHLVLGVPLSYYDKVQAETLQERSTKDDQRVAFWTMWDFGIAPEELSDGCESGGGGKTRSNSIRSWGLCC